MQTRRIISMILALALLVGVVAPGSLAVYADKVQTLYGENLEQVTEPVIGESYYLGADVNGTMMYFRHGTVSDTVPYSLVVSDNFNHNWVVPVTLEDPGVTDEKITTGFQLLYTRPDNQAVNRIYCYDTLKDEKVAGQTGIMDTGAGASSGTCYKNRHNFFIEDLDGVKVLKKTGNDNILVIKQVPQTANGETKNVWRMLGVPVEELANEGVYPVMLLQEHVHAFGGDKYEAVGSNGHKMVCWCGAVAAQTEAHTFGEAVVSGNAVTRSCTACGYAETAYDQKTVVTEPEIGGTYYLSANVNGTLKYFCTPPSGGSVANTTPYSLYTTESAANSQQVTLEDPTLAVEGKETGFQLTYDNGGKVARIYFLPSGDVINTGSHGSEAYRGRHTVEVATVNGMAVIRKVAHGSNANNNMVLVAKEMSQTGSDTTTTAWRMLVVPETELGAEGVYPVSLMAEHPHDFASGKPQGALEGHVGTCWCGAVGEKTEKHTYGEATISGNTASRACTACGYVETVYGEAVVMAEDAVVGNSYYLAANAGGTMVYFRHGTATDTAPYSLVATTNFNHNWVLPVTLEDPTLANEGTKVGFQLTYNRPDNGALTRIYCYDVLKDTADVPGQTGVMDTGINTANYKGRHTFMIDEVNGVKVLRKLSNNNILVAKYNETKKEWRMLGVPEAELANEGVYPVALALAHEHEIGEQINKITDTGHSTACWCGGTAEETAHTYGAVTADAANNTHSRSCTACGYTEVVFGQTEAQVKYPTVGQTYYLSANVNGTPKYFCTPPSGGSVTNTSPYSLYTTEAGGSSQQVTLLAAITAGKGEFQLSFDNGGAETFIYCHTTGTGTTKTSSTSYYVSEKASFYMDEVNGVSVLRKYGNDYVLVVKQLQNSKTGDLQWHMQCVPESELANEGVYPAMLTAKHEHTCADWTFDTAKGTQSKLCTVCGFENEKLYGTDVKGSLVTEPVIGNSYHLAANANGKLIFFRHGVATDTAPYSLVATENFNHNWVLPVTIEDPTLANEGTKVGFQLTYTNPSTGALARIYCYDVLKDTADVPGQTGVVDTGINSANYKGRHTFMIDEVNGVTVLRKLNNNNILVVKYNETKGEWRMLGVPEAELANEGVYPAMLMNVHEHSYNEDELLSDSTGHYHLCDCGSKQLTSHSFGQWTLDKATMQQTAACAVCGYELTVASPYFDTVDSLEELTSGLAETVLDEETGAYTVSGGKDYYLMTEIGDEMFYFRNAARTANGEAESVLTTSGYSLYVTNDPNNATILKTKVTTGNTEGTYVIYSKNDNDRAVYVNDEGKDGTVDTGLTLFRGIYDNATYKARSEFMWDEQTGYLYQLEDDVKYILVVKQMTATYGTETTTEWRLIAVPMADATPEKGNYPVKLANHIHNLTESFETEGASHWRACPCGYNAYVNWSIVPGESVGVNFDLKLEEGETVTVTVAGEEVPVELIDKGYGAYNAFIQLAAAQMNDQLTISVGGNTVEEQFSVRSFADMILADENASDNEKELVKAMLVYGGAAQNYFGYSTDNMADVGIDVAVTMPTDVEDVVVDDGMSDVRFYGASVVHEGRTALRFYFEAESVEGLTFTVDGNVYEPIAKDGKFYIEIGGINPQNLNKELNVVVTDGENNLAVAYSPLTNIVRTYQKAGASEELKALVQAMYGYHKAAKAYIANMYLGSDFARKSWTKTTLYEGVDQFKNIYVAADIGEVEAYAIRVTANANVELKVSAGSWSESSTASKPGQTKTVVKHFRDMKNAGNNVLAMINGGFFDLNSGKTMKPYGMQIVDGVVKQAPSAGSYSDNWFGMTKDGKYVISDAAGYASTYAGNIQQGIGGGKLLMIDGVAQNLTSGRDYRTAVGISAKGDLVLVAVENATYSDVNQIFVDMDMDIVTVLNLDGGGSTAMCVSGAFYPKTLIQGEDGFFAREVADAVGIVVK